MPTRIQPTTQLALLLRAGRSRRIWIPTLLLVVLLPLEILGRQSQNDLTDGLILCSLAMVALMMMSGRGVQHSRTLRRWWLAARGRISSLLAPQRFEIGIDLRGTPPIEPGIPPLIRRILILEAAVVAGLLMAELTGLPIRFLAVRCLYVGYLAGLGVLWGGLLLLFATAILLPAACIHDAFVSRWSGTTRARWRAESVAVALYFAMPLLATVLLPLWVPALLSVVAAATLLFALHGKWRPEITLLWRHNWGGQIRSLGWSKYETLCAGMLVLGYWAVLLAAVGSQAIGVGAGRPQMPVTELLGTVVAWLCSAAMIAGSAFAAHWIIAQRNRDPAQDCPTTLHIRGQDANRKAVDAVAVARGWRVKWHPEPVQPTDVQIAIVDTMPALGGRPQPRRLPVSLRGLAVEELQQMLQRRDHVQRRRLLMRGFERLFKSAARRSFRRGQGYWIAPHYWYVAGMTRDVDEDRYEGNSSTIVTGIIGPLYDIVFPTPVRQHLQQILRALEIDLLFVEDGVGFRRFRATMRVMFEHYDIHGGRQRLEERHLRGQPGTRAIIHDFQLGRVMKRGDYPEPDYETLGRARVLHVFRDRGDPDSPVIDPADIEDIPVPVGTPG